MPVREWLDRMGWQPGITTDPEGTIQYAVEKGFHPEEARRAVYGAPLAYYRVPGNKPPPSLAEVLQSDSHEAHLRQQGFGPGGYQQPRIPQQVLTRLGQGPGSVGNQQGGFGHSAREGTAGTGPGQFGLPGNPHFAQLWRQWDEDDQRTRLTREGEEAIRARQERIAEAQRAQEEEERRLASHRWWEEQQAESDRQFQELMDSFARSWLR